MDAEVSLRENNHPRRREVVLRGKRVREGGGGKGLKKGGGVVFPDRSNLVSRHMSKKGKQKRVERGKKQNWKKGCVHGGEIRNGPRKRFLLNTGDTEQKRILRMSIHPQKPGRERGRTFLTAKGREGHRGEGRGSFLDDLQKKQMVLTRAGFALGGEGDFPQGGTGVNARGKEKGGLGLYAGGMF